MERIIESADAAFPAWRDRTITERAALLQKAAALLRSRRDELSGVIIRESAKSWEEADGDVSEAIDFCDYCTPNKQSTLCPRNHSAT